jgi:peroxiredoxin (alkyl hydroperoxide reductase subunit C)
MAAVAVKYPAFQELGVEVLAVSVDDVATHKDWQEKELSKMVKGGALYPMISDPDGHIGILYGVYDEEKKVDLRGRFLIDPDGIVQSAEIVSAPVGRDVSEVLRQVRAFQHHRKTGELMPCGWQPGKPTLPPEKERSNLSGKVWETWRPRNAF